MKINLVTTSDWEWQALYVDGKLVSQTHNIEARDILELLGGEIEEVDVPEDFTEFAEKYEDNFEKS